MFIVSCVKSIGPKAAPLAVLGHTFFFIILSLSESLVKSWYKNHEQVAPVSNIAPTESQF